MYFFFILHIFLEYNKLYKLVLLYYKENVLPHLTDPVSQRMYFCNKNLHRILLKNNI